MTYSPFDVVVVPFPFTDRRTEKRRPALVLSRNSNFGDIIGHSVLAMITSLKNEAWPLDVPIRDENASGLSVPSVVRMKIFTLDNRLIIRKLGSLSQTDRKRVLASMSKLLKL